MSQHRPRLLPLIAVAALALVAACARAPHEIVLTGPTMGTTWNLRVVPGTADLRADVVRALVQAALDEVDATMSTYRADSTVSRFNASRSTEWFAVPGALAGLVAESLRIGTVTGGAFDITVAPLVRLWGFGRGTPRQEPPADAEITAALALTGQRHLQARPEPPALLKSLPGLELDLDSIAPGYAVDLVARRLEAAGADRYMIEIGGEVRVRGRNRDGAPWRIGIERPEERGRSVTRVLHLVAAAVSTSGDYRDYFESGGTRYSHTLDPESGRPVTHGLASVTVLRPTATEADGLATALDVLGPAAGFELAEREGWAALFIERIPGGFRQRETTAFQRASQAGESTP
jgi:thiamine biosynthesis lipoprotein